MTTRRREAARDERGAAAIIIAVLTVFFVVLAAFVTDFGMAYANKRILQNGVDAAALAAAQEIAVNADPHETCGTIAATMVSSTRLVAQAYFDANGASDGGAITSYRIECTAAGVVMVSVDAAETSANFFGGAAGPEHTDGIDLAASAKAAVGPLRSAIGLRPFAICHVDAAALRADHTQSRNIVLDNKNDRGCDEASGNFGLIDLDGGSNGTSDLRDWVGGGYDGEISIAPPIYLEGGPGSTGGGSLEGEMDSIVGDEVVLPVFESIKDPTGANADYLISGFIGVEVCGYEFGSKTNKSGACWDTFAEPDPDKDSYLQVRFKKFIAIGELDTTCGVGTACDNGTRVVKLAQ